MKPTNGALFSSHEAAILYDAQRILSRRIDANDLPQDDRKDALVAEGSLRAIVNRDAERAAK